MRTNLSIHPIALLYFAVALTEVICELLQYMPLVYVLKPMMPLLLIALYFETSPRRNLMFYAVMFFSAVTNLLFIPFSDEILFYGLLAFLVHRSMALGYIITLLNIRDYIPVIMATIPFLLVYFYLFWITDGIPEESFLVLILQNILISLMCGIALSHYLMNDDKRHSWLLICAILFGLLHVTVFVERFYLSGFAPLIFRPLAMGLNTFAFYTLYEFVMACEKSNRDREAIH